VLGGGRNVEPPWEPIIPVNEEEFEAIRKWHICQRLMPHIGIINPHLASAYPLPRKREYGCREASRIDWVPDLRGPLNPVIARPQAPFDAGT
jgi:hypothetical protein